MRDNYERIDCKRRRNHGIFLEKRSIVCERDAHHVFGNTYQYYAVVSEEEFRKGTLRNVIHKYFNNSYLSVVSSLVEEEDISLDELKQLIADVERGEVK